LYTNVAGVQQIVIAEGVAEGAGTPGIEQALGRHYLPFAIQLRVTDERRKRLSGSLPFIEGMTPVGGKTAVYICRDRACRAPVTAVDELEGALGS
jgi:uncharacterized protein YyaL (SSP411 family)